LAAKNKGKYQNILNTVVYFVSEEDFKRCSNCEEQEEEAKEESGDFGEDKPVNKLFSDLRKWGGL
jgi:hypothetical protein